ncbi:membrane-associated phospholipid phosphatase [Desulfosporosinus acidiphilus SJ4]|uniref:Membrane-associated phospholipid phosphatase n=1 Tax=Desulfosporosinus acidiphilus (strain DSM 22704 / JCM 16185 / SJ4) TaxID=646529 RepID=I4D5N3_DESAJ|nr:phosphatase PAP2 family protein [Desulfosporosinus acidiphilus]AFM41107.1 membrane-associated phospholipid phosphatase [Desulfosporosinus acidiphilus SJ4]
MNSFDLYIYHHINGLAGHYSFVDRIMAFFAQYALELYVVLFLLAWFTLPKAESMKRHALVVAGFSGVLALCFNVVIGHVFFRPRPFVALPKGTFNQLIPHSLDTSFPSDHTSGSFGFAAGSWRKTQFWVRRTFTVLAFIVAFARIYTGVHWPTDVLAGMVIGIFSARLTWIFNRKLKPLTLIALRLFRYGKFSKMKSRSVT